VTIAPPLGKPHSALVIVLHGLGDSADGFADVAQMWHKQMPYAKFVLPTAPNQPVTLNGGMAMNSWYDIEGLDERTNEKCAGIESSSQIVRRIMAEEATAHNLPYSRMVVSGFSQGGALSLFVGLQQPSLETKLAGVLVMSGYLAGAGQFTLTDAGRGTKTMHCHGTSDPMVRFSMAQKTETLIKEKGHEDYTLKPYNGMVHTVLPEEIKDALAFLQGVLPSDDSCFVAVKGADEMSVKELKAAIANGGLGKEAVGMSEKQ
jgi:lysophospholipase-2